MACQIPCTTKHVWNDSNLYEDSKLKMVSTLKQHKADDCYGSPLCTNLDQLREVSSKEGISCCA